MRISKINNNIYVNNIFILKLNELEYFPYYIYTCLLIKISQYLYIFIYIVYKTDLFNILKLYSK